MTRTRKGSKAPGWEPWSNRDDKAEQKADYVEPEAEDTPCRGYAVTPADLRALADDPQRYGPVSDALYEAADEIEKCQQLSRVRYEHAVKWQRERDALKAEVSRLREELSSSLKSEARWITLMGAAKAERGVARRWAKAWKAAAKAGKPRP